MQLLQTAQDCAEAVQCYRDTVAFATYDRPLTADDRRYLIYAADACAQVTRIANYIAPALKTWQRGHYLPKAWQLAERARANVESIADLLRRDSLL